MSSRVTRIVASQGGAGLQPTFLVLLEGSSKRVQRTRAQLEAEAPDLLADFLRSHDLSPIPSTSSDHIVDPETVASHLDRDSSPVVVNQAKVIIVRDSDPEMSSSSSEEDMDESSDFDIAKVVPEKKKQATLPSRSSGRLSKSSASSSSRQTHSYDEAESSEHEEDVSTSEKDEYGSYAPIAPTKRSSRDRRKPKTYNEEINTSDSGDELAIGGRTRASNKSSSSESINHRVKLRNLKAKAVKAVTDDDEEDDEIEENLVESNEKPLPFEYKHRDVCAKCGSLPVNPWLNNRRIARKSKKGRKKKAGEFEEDSEDEDERILKLGAWVECSVCISSYHFGCLPAILQKTLVNQLKIEWEAAQTASLEGDMVIDSEPEHVLPKAPRADRPKREKDTSQVLTVAKCMSCKRVGGRKCFECSVSGRKPTSEGEQAVSPSFSSLALVMLAGASASKEAAASDSMDVDAGKMEDKIIPPLMFRCVECKRACHYECLGAEEGNEDQPRGPLHEAYYKDGRCHECFSWTLGLDVILAWKPDDEESTVPEDIDEDDIRPDVETVRKTDEKTGKVYEIPSADDPFASAYYLCKWADVSYRWLQWLPHSFLASKHHAKLANFLAKGSLVSFAPPPLEDEKEEDADDDAFAKVGSAPLPDPQAQERIPKAWSQVDRLLDVIYLDKKFREQHYADYHKRLPEDPEESVKLVSRVYMKWTELPYSASTLETPPQPGEEGYDAFYKAYCRFLESRQPVMRVPNLSAAQMSELDKPRNLASFKALQTQPDFIKNGQLMDFQLAGVNFLYQKWWRRQGAILADEMGLGKTVQVITFLSLLYKKEGARPFLVVVPNSTLGNWAREFERWAPAMRVVAYGGDAPSRQIIESYELFDNKGNLKSHVVLATYESLEKNAPVFRKVARWDTLVVDEAQRLKGGTSGLLHKALNSLRIGSRVLLTGTPLNNVIGELFNLLRFIDPANKTRLNELEASSSDLTPAAIDEIRSTLQGYMLRRTKQLVLDLPPLNEMIVPVTMSGLQRKLYTSILERNVDFIASITKSAKAGGTNKRKKGVNNVLMELRKTLGHPYLVDQDIERTDVDRELMFQNFVRASTKLELLSKLLPKLKQKGHKVLIFSQFKLNLNILEDFLSGIGIKYLRLDGDTEQLERQRRINAFQAADSDYECFVLSTRAGGVGITLTAADTVVMYDADFNPHQDVQAISRAHRIGQTKPVRVFKLVVKGSCEEKIMAAGRDKMQLDYLIIQRVEEKSESEDLESILQFGAKALFDEQDFEKRAIVYTDDLVDDLIKKADEPPKQDQAITEGAAAFAQFQVYEAGNVVDGEGLGAQATAQEDLHDFWDDILRKNEEERDAQRLANAETAGRGKRRKADVDYRLDAAKSPKRDGPSAAKRTKSSSSSGLSSGDEYRAKRTVATSEDDDDFVPVGMEDVVVEDTEARAAVTGLAAPNDASPSGSKTLGETTGAERPKKSRRKASEVADEKARKHAALDRAELLERLHRKETERRAKLDDNRRVKLRGLSELSARLGDTKLAAMVSQAYRADPEELVLLIEKAFDYVATAHGESHACATGHIEKARNRPLLQKPAIANGAKQAVSRKTDSSQDRRASLPVIKSPPILDASASNQQNKPAVPLDRSNTTTGQPESTAAASTIRNSDAGPSGRTSDAKSKPAKWFAIFNRSSDTK